MDDILVFLVAAISSTNPNSTDLAESQTVEPPVVVADTAVSSMSVADGENAVLDEEPAVTSMTIPKDMPVHLMVLNEVSSKDHQPGHRFKLRVNKPVAIDDNIIIPVGARAWGELLAAEKAGNAGKSGTINTKLLYIEMDDMQIPIYGESSAKGRAGTGETVVGILALGPLGLFAKGNDARLKAGEKMVAFVSEDIDIPATELQDD